MSSFQLVATFGGLNLNSGIRSDMVDDLIEHWSQVAARVSPEDPRGATRDFVIKNMLENRHHTDREVGELVAEALLWIIAKGSLGERLVPFMRRGDMTVYVEITSLNETKQLYNFRVTTDEKTASQMTL